MVAKDRFLEIYKEHITREGSDKLLDYLKSNSSDSFIAPASTRFHGSYESGLIEYSINVYDCLADYLNRDKVKNSYHLSYDNESIAMLHDLCKINC